MVHQLDKFQVNEKMVILWDVGAVTPNKYTVVLLDYEVGLSGRVKADYDNKKDAEQAFRIAVAALEQWLEMKGK